MKGKIYSAFLLTLLTITLSSCLGDNDETEIIYYDDTALTSFTLGTLKREVHVLGSTGEDSTYWTTVDCSSYKFHINQVTGEIYNTDSLPTGTYVKKALCNAVAKNSGTPVINLKEEGSDADSLLYMASTDSVDLSVEREIRVYNSLQTAFRSYTLKVNVHQEEADSFRWSAVNTTAPVLNAKNIKTVSIGKKIVTLSNANEASATALFDTETLSWSLKQTTLDANAWANLVASSSKAYTISDGYIVSLIPSENSEWQNVAAATDVRRLVGAAGNALFAISQNMELVVSTDEGQTWSKAILDNENYMLPETEVCMASLPLKTNASTNTIVLLGNTTSTAQGTSIWAAVSEENKELSELSWFFYTQYNEDQHLLPVMTNRQLIAYDGALLTIGQKNNSLSSIYQSNDRGLTWHESTSYVLPDEFKSQMAASANVAYAMTVDSDNNIWLISSETGNIWRGRLNRLGWEIKN